MEKVNKITELGQEEVWSLGGHDLELFVDGENEVLNRRFTVQEGKKSKILKILEPSRDNLSYSVKIEVFDNAELDLVLVLFGNSNCEVNVLSEVRGSRACSNISVLYFADCPGHLKLSVRNNFFLPHACGKIDIRGVACNQAKVEVFGEIGIAREASETDSRLDQHALIYGKGTRVRQLPILEINTNNVKAGHGATVSKVQEEDLFYFLSRGIPRNVAYKLCVNGFFAGIWGLLSDFDNYYRRVFNSFSERVDKNFHS